VPYQPDEAEAELLKLDQHPDAQLYQPKGCVNCEQVGYRGRLGIYELVKIDEQMRVFIHEGASEDELAKQARTKTRGLMDNGIERVLQGETTLDEVFRVTQA